MRAHGQRARAGKGPSDAKAAHENARRAGEDGKGSVLRACQYERGKQLGFRLKLNYILREKGQMP